MLFVDDTLAGSGLTLEESLQHALSSSLLQQIISNDNALVSTVSSSFIVLSSVGVIPSKQRVLVYRL